MSSQATASVFPDAFGVRRGHTGLGDLLAGKNTAAARQVASSLAQGFDYAAMLDVLRAAHNAADELYAPLRECIVARVGDRALRFIQHTDIEVSKPWR